MNSNTERYDAVVIGAGVGGLAAATRLTLAGYRTLLVEALDRVGGRASTRPVDGFLLNTGALAIECDGPVPQLLADAGASIDLYVPEARRSTVLLWGKREINAGSGPIAWARNALPAVLRTITKVPRFQPRPGESTTDWLNRFTTAKAAHELLDNVLGGFFAASGRDVPADAFVTYMIEGSGFKNLGYAPGGTIEVWKPLVAAIEARGSEVWLNARVTRLTLGPDGLVDGVEIERDGGLTTVRTAVVVSNVGPLATARMVGAHNLPAGYVDDVEKSTSGGAILTVHFASKTPLVKWPALAFGGKSRRLTYANNYQAVQHARSKPGWFLYSASSTPRPACGDFDLDTERELLLADVRDFFPGFDEYATILDWDINAHDWPAQRAITGHDLPIETPIANLWNVGDGVKIGADAGTAACVRTADAVVAQIRAAFPVDSTAPRAILRDTAV